MLAHIYSYCDVKTLVVLSLVSFGSWEMAAPILYEHVELTSLDAIKALLFLVRVFAISFNGDPPRADLESAGVSPIVIAGRRSSDRSP